MNLYNIIEKQVGKVLDIFVLIQADIRLWFEYISEIAFVSLIFLNKLLFFSQLIGNLFLLFLLILYLIPNKI